jgi:hypothetical protein
VCFKCRIAFLLVSRCYWAVRIGRTRAAVPIFVYLSPREAINWATGTLFDKNVNWIERDMSYDPPASLFGELLTSPAFFGRSKFPLQTLYSQIFAFKIYPFPVPLVASHFFTTSVTEFISPDVSSSHQKYACRKRQSHKKGVTCLHQ